MKIFFKIFFTFLILIPFFSEAKGLVPCGGPEEPACQLCHFFLLIKNIIDFFLKNIVLPVAALIFVIGGFMFLFSFEDPERIKRGRSILFSAVLGVFFIFCSWLLINLFFEIIGVAEIGQIGFDLKKWFEIPCPIQ